MELLRSQLHQFYCQLNLPGSKHRFMHSPAVGELAFWFKSPSNVVAYEYNPVNHSQTCTHNFASMNQRDAIVNTVCSFIFFLREIVHSSMCLAFQACCLPCSAGCPLPCSIWQIGGDTLPFPLRAGGLVTAALGTPFLPSLASGQREGSLLLPINFPVGKNILGLPCKCVLLLISHLLPHTKTNRASIGFLNKLQPRLFSRCLRCAHLQPTFLMFSRHCRGDNLPWLGRGTHN